MTDDIDGRPPSSGSLSRRNLIVAGGVALVAGGVTPTAAPTSAATPATPLKDYDPIRSELVMNLLVTCSSPEPMGDSSASKDGDRARIWPIIGGRFRGPRLGGKVIPGGADFPVTRPDGVSFVDAFYRIQEDDGTLIIIHNMGMAYPELPDGRRPYRLSPSFTTVEGPHDWLNKSIFVATLTYGPAVPPEMRLAKGPNENDRLIQVHRIF